MTWVLVLGTGTGVGKTWVAAHLLAQLRARGLAVAARKPVQSFDEDAAETPDAQLLADASGEDPNVVCAPTRTYPLALAPPIAAAELGVPAFSVRELIDEMTVPPPATSVVIVEGVGGPRSPLATDGDNVTLADALSPALVVLVSGSGLGAINDVELGSTALSRHSLVVFLNRFERQDRTHLLNREWLLARGHTVLTEIPALVDTMIEASSTSLRSPRHREDE